MVHENTFKYIKPTDDQLESMDALRYAFASITKDVDRILPDGFDKDHVIRLIRDAAMWSNIAMTRYDDGSPRK